MEPFSHNVALLAKQNPLLAATLRPGGEIAWRGEAVSGTYDVVFVEGVEKALLVEEYTCKVVVVETDAEKMGAFLSTKEASRCLENPRFSLAFVAKEEDYLLLAWEHLFLEAYCECAALKHYLSIVHCIGSEYRDFGARIFSNLLANSDKTLLDGAPLKGAFAGVPAIVCGAGPSLEKNPDAEKAIVFACGSAMALVENYHFGVALDPNPPLERFLAAKKQDAPLLIQNRASQDIVAACQGTVVSFPPNGNYPVEEAIYGERGTLQSGWNAGTFGVAMAHYFGCAPIYISGIDGGYVDGKRYAEGIEEDGTVTDLELGRAWIAEYNVQPLVMLEKNFPVDDLVQEAMKKLVPLRASKEILDSCRECDALLTALIEDFDEKGKRLLHEALLTREPFYTLHLEPIWKIWQWVIERDGAYRVNFSEPERLLNKSLFFQKVVRQCYDR